MSEKILGFREVKRNFQASTTNNEKIWAVFESDLVPVVSVEEFERYKSEVETIILEKNRKIMEWENQPVVTFDRLKEYCKGKQYAVEGDDFRKGYNKALENLYSVIRKSLEDEKNE